MNITICGNDECINSSPQFCAACAEVEQDFRREVGEAWFEAARKLATDLSRPGDTLDVESQFRVYHGGRLYGRAMGGVTVEHEDAAQAERISDQILAAANKAASEAVERIKASLAAAESEE